MKRLVNSPLRTSLGLARWARLTLSLALIAASLGALPASSAPRSSCDEALSGLQAFSFSGGLEIPRGKLAKAKALAAKYGVTFKDKDFFSLVSSVYAHILATEGRGLEPADKMATFGEELDELLVGATKEVRQGTWFSVADAVNKLEEFQVSEFRRSTSDHRVAKYNALQSKFPVENNPTGLIHFKDYANYAKAYVKHEAPYTLHTSTVRQNSWDTPEGRLDSARQRLANYEEYARNETDEQMRSNWTQWMEEVRTEIRDLEAQLASSSGPVTVSEATHKGYKFQIRSDGVTMLESGGVLSIPDYRDIVAHNMWPLWLAPHDMYHVHFAYGHAKGVSMVFRSARGRNHRRFVMMGGMYEGVDTFQYSHESGLARYFSEVKQMGLEDSLLWLSKASRKELQKIIDDSGIDISDFEDQLKDYVPGIKGTYKGLGITGDGLDQETNAFIEMSAAHVKDPITKPFTNYHRSAPDVAGSTWDKDYAHFGGMMNMPAPNEARPTMPTDTPFQFDHSPNNSGGESRNRPRGRPRRAR